MSPRQWVRISLACLLILAAAVSAAAAWLVPLPLPVFPGEGRAVQAALSLPASASQPSMEILDLSPGSREERAVENILSHYQIHRCLHTLTGLEEWEEPSVLIRTSEFSLAVADSCHVYLNGTLYRVGWLGEYQGRKLADELSWALGLGQCSI